IAQKTKGQKTAFFAILVHPSVFHIFGMIAREKMFQQASQFLKSNKYISACISCRLAYSTRTRPPKLGQYVYGIHPVLGALKHKKRSFHHLYTSQQNRDQTTTKKNK